MGRFCNGTTELRPAHKPALSDYSIVGVNCFAGDRIPVISLHHHPIRVQRSLASPLRKLKGVKNPPRERLWVVRMRRDRGLGVLNDLGETAHLRRHDWKVGRHRFERDNAKWLIEAWKGAHVG